VLYFPSNRQKLTSIVNLGGGKKGVTTRLGRKRTRERRGRERGIETSRTCTEPFNRSTDINSQVKRRHMWREWEKSASIPKTLFYDEKPREGKKTKVTRKKGVLSESGGERRGKLGRYIE